MGREIGRCPILSTKNLIYGEQISLLRCMRSLGDHDTLYRIVGPGWPKMGSCHRNDKEAGWVDPEIPPERQEINGEAGGSRSGHFWNNWRTFLSDITQLQIMENVPNTELITRSVPRDIKKLFDEQGSMKIHSKTGMELELRHKCVIEAALFLQEGHHNHRL
ncbi:hypothetical protein CAPTEDRAFT_217833 [Capitella teleta]|uniref:Uncharacterized protein n=1 Tax=Capitella teleta TaxID=283909 RepID=R7VFU1_CAPTE|nr:hypothetical protein CAPTEDRAFT_217833 [Capitella teleta]|eukprot:ELU17693.1 hypothetical protein CAPTEDRAFT_217833 [Capitella teleta]